MTYGLNDNDSDTQALQNGDTVHDVFTLYVTDGTAGNSTTVDFTDHGANDDAVVGGALTGSVHGSRAASTTARQARPPTGTLTDTDVDNAAEHVPGGDERFDHQPLRHFSLDTSGNWVYTVDDSNASVQALNVGGTLNDTFTVATRTARRRPSPSRSTAPMTRR